MKPDMAAYWASVDALGTAGGKLAKVRQDLREEARVQKSRSAESLAATRKGIDQVDAGSTKLLAEARTTLGRLGLQGQLADTGRRTGGPPLDDLSQLDPFVTALKKARSRLDVAVSDEEKRRATPAPAPVQQSIPEPTPAPTHWLPWIALGILAVVIVIVVLIVL